MGIISGKTGTVYADQDIKDWFNATPRTEADIAQRSSELGLTSEQVTTAMTVGQNKPQSQANVNSWVADKGNGYEWDGSGQLKKSAAPPPTAPPTANTASAPFLTNPTAWNVTPDQTVESRINGIINGSVGEQARGRAMGTMNERGLSNSSIAIGAGEDAALTAAIPIATTDAGTFAKAAGYNADQNNQFAMKKADISTQYGLAGMQDATTRIGQQNQLEVAKLNAATNTSIAALDNTQKDLALKLQIDNKTLLDTNAQSAQAFNTAMTAVNNINLSPNMDANTKTQGIANVWHSLQAQLNVLGAVAGLDLTSKLSFASYPGFDAAGNWIGFPADSATATTATDTAADGTAAATTQQVDYTGAGA